MEVIGLDIGFGYTKCTNGTRFLVFKSVFGEVTEAQFREQLLNEVPDEEHLQIELDGRAYFVGELAERQSTERYFTLDQGQFISEFTRVLSLCALARMVDRQEPVKVVVGLPIGHYARHRADLATILKGQHDVGVVSRGGERTQTVVRVAELRVVPQPFGTVMNIMLNDVGEVKDKRLLSQKMGVIDIGFRTADFTIADHTRYSERGSLTTESGISRAFATIAAKLQETSGVNIELYRMFDAVDRGTIKIHGKRYDLKRITEQAFSQLAGKIAADATRLWASDWDLDAIVISGGGGAVLAPYLQPQLKGEVIALEPGKDARMNNVRGYVKYAKRLWTRGVNPPPAQ
jgi:plasmid segregation protein ParM